MTRTRLIAWVFTLLLLVSTVPAGAVAPTGLAAAEPTAATAPAQPTASIGVAAPQSTASTAMAAATASTAGRTLSTAAAQSNETTRPDPGTDVIGWENGYWYNESIPVTNLDGLNETERETLVARSMARVEYVRQKEFGTTVPVTTISRATYRQRTRTNYTDRFKTFDNAKFEAMFMVGEDEDSIAVQRSNRGSSVLGYYDSRNDTITIVTDSSQPVLDGEGTLAHELVHALQDQYFNLTSIRASTRDQANAQNGIVEGEANFVQRRYTTRCGEAWGCIDAPSENSAASPDLHFGIYFLQFFPYSDGPGLVQSLYRQGGWDAVDRAFEDLPERSDEVIYPDQYGTDGGRTTVNLTDRTSGDWERIRPEPQRPTHQRPDYATLGQSALSSMFIYTAYANRGQPLVGRTDFLNFDEDGTVNRSDPIDYDLQYSDGWQHDRLHAYRNPSAGTNETAYVWRIRWESDAEAGEFVEGYRQLLQYWGGSEVDGEPNTWRIDDGPFADAFYIDTDGDTVTIVNAPTVEDLPDIYPGAGQSGDDSGGATTTTTDGDGAGTTDDDGAGTTDGDGAGDTTADSDGERGLTDGSDGAGGETGTATSGPGFTAALALVALLGATLLVARRQ